LAGQGVFMARTALDGLDLRVSELAERMGPAAAQAGPATAVALLLAGR